MLYQYSNLFQLATVTTTQVCVFLIRQSMNRMIEPVEVFVLSAYIIQLDGNVGHVLPTSIINKECLLVIRQLVFVSIIMICDSPASTFK